MAKTYPIAHEESELIVGQNYRVAHVHVNNPTTDKPIDIDVPIIPILHSDAKNFNVKDYNHYHLDGRFIANKSPVARIWRTDEGYTGGIVTAEFGNELSEVFYKVKKCLRLETGLAGWPTEAFFKWKKSMAGKSCKGRICPHYGAIMSVRDGKLVCPMHGLRGDINKEIIINE